MNAKKPQPLFKSRQRKLCPVCGNASYSRAGVHPQCAQQQADEKRVARLKAKRKRLAKAEAKKSAPLVLKAWHKRCPKCRQQVHVRKAACDCGFQFVGGKTSTSS